MKTKYLTFVLLSIAAAAASVFAQTGTIVIVDPTIPTIDEKPRLTSSVEEDLIKNLLPAVRKVWDKETCEETFSITGAAAGAFTKAGTQQKAFVYEFCQTGNGLANDGIVITENGRLVAHFIYEGAQTAGLERVPDLNGNGTDELLVTNYGGMHQGISATGIDVLDAANGAIKEIGATQIDYDDSGAYESPKAAHVYSYKISVKPGAKPIFYSEKFVKRGKVWRKVGAAQKAEMFALEYKYSRVK